VPRVRGQRMIAVAENLASTPIVRDRYADPFAAQPLAPDVDRAIALSGAQLVDLAGSDNVVRASSEPYPSVWQLLSGAGERLLVYLGLGLVRRWSSPHPGFCPDASSGILAASR
jgi:hypothetical protein